VQRHAGAKQQYSVCVSVIVSKTVLLNRQNINTRNIPCAAHKTAQRCVAIEFNERRAISAREGDGMEKQKMKSTIKRLLLAGAFAALGVTAAFAQSMSARNHATRQQPYASYEAVPSDGPDGSQRGTGYGQGGTAGTHPTGANVGPARAAMDHATGP
jgi:hypothetical protein